MASFYAFGNLVFFFYQKGALYYFLAQVNMKNDARKKKLLDAPFKDEISKSRIEKERAVKNQYGEGISYIPQKKKKKGGIKEPWKEKHGYGSNSKV